MLFRSRERERYMYISDWALVRYLGFREKMRDGFRFWARWVKPDMLGYTLNSGPIKNDIKFPEGDWLCLLSAKRPVWFAVRESGSGEREKRVLESEIGLCESLGGGFEFDNGVDVEALDIDPVKGM